MSEQRRDKVCGQTILLCAACPNASCGKWLEFPQCKPHRFLMGCNNPLICTYESHQSNGLRRRKSEIVKNHSLGRALVTLLPHRVQSLCQRLARPRMLIFAELEKLIRANSPCQSESFRGPAKPFS